MDLLLLASDREPPIYTSNIWGKEGGEVNIVFRNKFKELVNLYRSKGGLSRFALDLRSSSFDLKTEWLFHSLLQTIEDAIIRGTCHIFWQFHKSRKSREDVLLLQKRPDYKI